MQQDDKKVLQFNQILGALVKSKREEKGETSLNKFSREYDLDRGNMSKLENGLGGCRVVTLWKISEALGLKLSDFIKILEKKLGKDFKLIDE